MNDCEAHGHPLVDGIECPCGRRQHPTRHAPPPPAPWPPPLVITMHLERHERRRVYA